MKSALVVLCVCAASVAYPAHAAFTVKCDYACYMLFHNNPGYPWDRTDYFEPVENFLAPGQFTYSYALQGRYEYLDSGYGLPSGHSSLIDPGTIRMNWLNGTEAWNLGVAFTLCTKDRSFVLYEPDRNAPHLPKIKVDTDVW
jgi:hypothetical protein